MTIAAIESPTDVSIPALTSKRPFDIWVCEGKVIEAISSSRHDGMTRSELSLAVNMTYGSVTKLLSNLGKIGLVRKTMLRRPDLKTGNESAVYVTCPKTRIARNSGDLSFEFKRLVEMNDHLAEREIYLNSIRRKRNELLADIHRRTGEVNE